VVTSTFTSTKLTTIGLLLGPETLHLFSIAVETHF